MSQSLSTHSPTAASLANAPAASGTTSGAGAAGQNALASLTNNFQTFLQMLMTQLQNQDPTSPMNSSQFTTELVQFAGVEQQIGTNSNLTQLIQLTQGNSVMQSGQLLGKHVQVSSNQLSLQNGTAQVAFAAQSAGPVAIAVYDSFGQQIYTATVTAAPGTNGWTWNGQTAAGTTAADGAYRVAVAATAADGTTTTLPFSVIGTVTGVHASGATVRVDLGGLEVDMSAVTAVAG